MITEFVERFMNNKDKLRKMFEEKHPSDYEGVVYNVISILASEKYGDIDPNRIHCIDDGDYQGTLLFVIASNGYQPSDYWYVRVSYGSCSGCDTLESIKADYRSYEDFNIPNKQQVDDYMTLALHIVQGLKEIQ